MRLGKAYNVERIYLFGSYARGEAKTTSDVDLRIDTGELKGFFSLSGLCLDLQNELGKKVDLLPSDSLSEKFLQSIKPEEIILYEAAR